MRHSGWGWCELMLRRRDEGNEGVGRAACLWQVVKGFNGVTDELGSEKGLW